MRKHRTLFVASFAVLSISLFAVRAQAAVPEASADVCDTLQAAYDAEPPLSQLGGSDFDASSFKSAAAMFKSAAADVPPDVAKALKKMSKYYEKLGKAKNYKVALTSITAKDTAKFTTATIVFDTYRASEC